MTFDYLHSCNKVNARVQDILADVWNATKINGMKKMTFKEVIDEAVKPYPTLLKPDGKTVNFSALARLYEERGHPITNSTLWRTYNGETKPSESTIDATHEVWRLPKSLIRGEPMTAEMEEVLTKYSLSTLMLAAKIERLRPREYQNLIRHIDLALEAQEQLDQALKNSGKVTPIDKHKK